MFEITRKGAVSSWRRCSAGADLACRRAGEGSGRQGGAGSVLVRAARRRHAKGLLQEARARRRIDRVRRRRQDAAGRRRRQPRVPAGLGTGHGLHRQGLAGQGRRRDGGSAAVARHRRASRWTEDRRGPQGQEDQRLDAGLSHLFPRERDLAPSGLGPNGIDIKPMGAMPGPNRRPEARRHRRRHHGYRQCLAPREAGRRTHIGSLHRHEGLPHPRDLCHGQDHRRQARRRCAASWRVGSRSIQFMRKNKDETVKIAMEVTQKDAEITNSVYDELMPMFSDTAGSTARRSRCSLNRSSS